MDNVGQITPLTDAQIKSLQAVDSRIRKADGGSEVFRLAYRYAGQQRALLTGHFRTMRRAEARLARDEAKAALRRGDDTRDLLQGPEPRPAPAPPRSTRNEGAGCDLRQRRRDDAAERTFTKLTYRIEPACVAVRARDICDIRPTDLIALVRGIEPSGRVETAPEVRTWCSQIFRFAIARAGPTLIPRRWWAERWSRRRAAVLRG